MMYLDTPRLPGGFFTLEPPAGAQIVGGAARINLYTASLSMTLQVADAPGDSDRLVPPRELSLGAVVAADRPGVLLLTGTVLASFNLSWTNRAASSGRGADPNPNPPARCSSSRPGTSAPAGAATVTTTASTTVCEQDLLAGGGFAMARTMSCAAGGGCTLFATLSNSVPAGVRSPSSAVFWTWA